jgi:polyhydroxyalkanoate synthase
MSKSDDTSSSSKSGEPSNGEELLSALWEMPMRLSQSVFSDFGKAASGSGKDAADGKEGDTPMFSLSNLPFSAENMSAEDMQHWSLVAARLQELIAQFQAEMVKSPGFAKAMQDPQRWTAFSEIWLKQMPLADPARQQELWQDAMSLWQGALGQWTGGNIGSETGAQAAGQSGAKLRQDRRFADPAWSGHPAAFLIHQTYLLIAENLSQLIKDTPGLSAEQRSQLQFAAKAMIDSASPANFALTNPVVMKRTVETRGDNLVKGLEHLLSDLRRGQLTHTDPDAFTLGENIANTPGKVVYETDLFQLIQYTPTTDKVLSTPLVIFPPWINRFYILDLNEKKSFVRWVLAQGVSVFMVSWKSADSSMAEIIWDDYIRAQIEAIDHVRTRLDVPDVHAIGYCVAGTTLAASLALMTSRGEADRVKSATFFTAQVDFEKAGELLNFIDDQQLAAIKALSPEGYLDGRFMAAAFNMLRGKDLIWNYVVNNYLLGEDYPAFDLLHWNGDVTNLPAKWHQAYLAELYRDNRLVRKNSLSIDGTPLDLSKVKTPSYVQAGREDHIAPAESVWCITQHFQGPMRFLLAGSGHIAGVVNPPSSGKYQYWTNDKAVSSLEEFVESADEHPGSWWPDWIDWLRAQGSDLASANGKRIPGGKGDSVIEDAPGRYVKTR